VTVRESGVYGCANPERLSVLGSESGRLS
jgi:hypothetical protein